MNKLKAFFFAFSIYVRRNPPNNGGFFLRVKIRTYDPFDKLRAGKIDCIK
jgi:hypothetical protein